MGVLELLRLPLAALVLLVPAVAMGRALAPHGTGWLLRVAWGLGASLAFLMVAGLVLHAIHALHAEGWLLAWAVLLSMVSIAWWLRRMRRPGEAAHGEPPAVRAASSLPEGLGGRQRIMLLAALCIVVGAVEVAREGAYESLRARSTELWAVPVQGKMVVGVRNREGQVMNYRIELKSGNQVREFLDLPAMAADTVYEHTLAGVVSPGAGASTQVLLYRGGETVPYRHVSFVN